MRSSDGRPAFTSECLNRRLAAGLGDWAQSPNVPGPSSCLKEGFEGHFIDDAKLDCPWAHPNWPGNGWGAVPDRYTTPEQAHATPYQTFLIAMAAGQAIMD